jgi:hypothetical protein
VAPAASDAVAPTWVGLFSVSPTHSRYKLVENKNTN